MTDVHLEELLVRFLDALFDAAWLNTNFYQRGRRPNRASKSDFGVSPVEVHVCSCVCSVRFGDFFNTPA